ncbi:MAG: ABC transporter ATP-binding protein [Candidatus Bathyarchaeia archaeon]
MARVTLEDITHSYNGKSNAVEDVNLTFEDRTASAILGPSGCGKTTILKIIAGLLQPTKGRIYFDDQDVTELPPEQRDVAIVFQFPVVYSMSVYDNLMFPLLNLNISKEEKRRKVLEVAESIGLKDLLDRHAPSLGPADKQRVAIGRVLIRKPKVFLFDEPLSSIEPDRRVYLKTEIKRIQETLQQTTIYVTHDQTEALTFAEKVAVMEMGKVAQFDTVDNIYAKPNTAFVGFFIGSPGMNILDGENLGDSVNLRDFSIILPPNIKLPENVKKVKVGIRPEHVEVSAKERKDWACFKVETFEDLGKGFGILHIITDSHRIRARSTIFIPEGSNVWINFPLRHVSFFDEEGKRINI